MSDADEEKPTLDYARPPVHRQWRLVLPIAIAHFIGTVVLFFVSLSLGMSRFDTGGPAPVGEQIAGIAVQVLSLPLVTAFYWLRLFAPGPAGWLVFVANSMCWGLAIAWLIDRWRGRRARERHGRRRAATA